MHFVLPLQTPFIFPGGTSSYILLADQEEFSVDTDAAPEVRHWAMGFCPSVEECCLEG